MRQKKLVNAIIIVAGSALFLVLWFWGLNHVYAEILKAGTNLFLSPWPDTYLEMDSGTKDPTFIVHTIIEGRKGHYPQSGKLILLPFIMVLTWQLLLLFNIPAGSAVRSLIENFLIFYIVQIIYMLLLTQFYESDPANFMFRLLTDSFYIIVLFLIVKDTIRYRLIKLKG
jgi:hypothetical protein